MKTFAKVIAASAGVVLLLFVLVGGLAYWSDDDIPAAIAHLDAAPPTPTPSPTAPAPQPERIATPPAPTKPQPSPAPTIKVKRQTPAPAAPTKAREKAAKTKVETMSHEEYLAREMHYIEKIQKDAEAVLERAAEERQKVAALEAQLDVLLFP